MSEGKIVFVLSYWIVHALVMWTASSIRTGRSDIFDHYLRSYAACMSGGNRKHHDCHSLRLQLEAEMNPVIDLITLISIALLNFASLPFVIQYQTVKNFIRRAARKLYIKTTA